MDEKDSYIILAVSVVDVEKTPLDLPIATLSTSSGYRIKFNNDIVPCYSPIDISICGLTALHNREQSVTSLNDWFIKNIDPLGELWVTCTVAWIEDEVMLVETHSVIEWKLLCKTNKQLKTLFKKNAPFAFKNIS